MKLPKLYDDHAEYHQALGVFVEMYASTERMTHILLWSVAGVDMPTGQAIWPSVRVSVAVSTIRRLHEARGETIPPLLDEALSHLITITGLRDNILHYGTMPDEKGRLVSTEMQSYSPDRLVSFRVTRPLLNSLIQDLQIVINRMATYHNTPTEPEYQAAFEQARLSAQTPFVYKHPQPRSKSPQAPKVSPQSKRQRNASRKKY